MTTDESDQRQNQPADDSRRDFLQKTAAAGAIAGLGGIEIVGASRNRARQQDGGGFFEDGPEIGVMTVAEGMTAPTSFAAPDDGSGRMFVTDQTGEVWVVTEQNGRRNEPFVNVSDKMVTLGEFDGDYADQQQDYDERGLLGIEFHPDFQNNRKFYLHYSAPRTDDLPDNWDHIEVVSEFKANEDGTKGNAGSERRLLEMPSPQYNHDSGPIAFGPDGYLYVPMGDGGGANDDMYGHVDDWYQQNGGGNGQDTTENLLGSVLRIDVDNKSDGKPYGIPDDNPFVGSDAGLDEHFAWGFRNPFGISFDSNGRIFVADAGQDTFEEVDIVEKGGNYGWNVKEGTHCFSTDSPSQHPDQCPSSTPDNVRGGEPLLDPIVEYPHTYQGESVGIVVIGGHFYEQNTVSKLNGWYIFGEWTTDPTREAPGGRVLAAADPEMHGTPEQGDGGQGDQVVPRGDLWRMVELSIAGSDDGTLKHFVRQFGQDNDGEVYILASRLGIPQGDTGVMFKIVPPGEGDSVSGGTVTPTGTPGEEKDATETETGTPTGTDGN